MIQGWLFWSGGRPMVDQKSGFLLLLSSYMEYGFTPKILKIYFAQIIFFTDKKS
jgi:hypothetical protein